MLYSGGKDSTLALHYLLREHELHCLLTMLPRRKDSWMYHTVNLKWVPLQAEAMELPLILAPCSGEKEREVKEMKEVLGEIGVEAVGCGAIASEYQKSRIERACKSLGLKLLAPLWEKDPATLLREFIELGYEAIIVGVYAMGFDKSWLGRRIDEDCLRALKELSEKYGINLSGEGGEYETFVTNGPLFKRRIKIEKARRWWRKNWGIYSIQEATSL